MWNPILVNQVRDWVAQLFVWDLSEKQHINRAVVAKANGLPDAMYARPFPGSVPNSLTAVNMQQPAPASPAPVMPAPSAAPTGGLSTLAKVGIAAALAAGTGGAGLGLWTLAGNVPNPAATSTTTTNTSGFDITLEQAKPK